MPKVGKSRDKTPGSGRVKGTPNKRTLDLMQKCEERGLDPFSVLLDMLKESDVMVRLQAAKELCQYLYPKRKPIEPQILPSEESRNNDAVVAEIRKVLHDPKNERKG